MSVLVTGAKGFVGRHLCTMLKQLECQVIELDLPEPDIRDAPALQRILAVHKPATVYHLAAQASVAVSWADPLSTIAVNSFGTTALLESVRQSSPGTRIVVVSSACVFEGADTRSWIPEDTQVSPVSPYGISKAVAEQISQHYAAHFDLDVVITRVFNVTGSGQRSTYVVPALAQRVIEAARNGTRHVSAGNTAAIRDFIDVRDMVDALRMIAERGASGTIYNVCSGRGRTIAEIAGLLIGLSGIDIEVTSDLSSPRKADADCLIGDPTLTAAQIGWRNSISFDETLASVFQEWQRRE